MKNFKSNSKRTVRVLPLLLVMLSLCSVALAAPGWSSMSARQSDQTELSDVQRGAAWQSDYRGYQSQIFEVGTTAVPSDYSEVSSSSSNPHHGNSRRLGGGTDPGEQSELSPIGEPWIMVLFAVFAVGIIAFKRRNSIKE